MTPYAMGLILGSVFASIMIGLLNMEPLAVGTGFPIGVIVANLLHKKLF